MLSQSLLITLLNLGVLYILLRTSISFEGNSTTEFTNNTAEDDGGAIISSSRKISFINFSHTIFNNNVAKRRGGAIYVIDVSVLSKSNSYIEFNNNAAARGGAICLYSSKSFIFFGEFSATVFNNNVAKDYGGAITAERRTRIIFCNNSTVTFIYNNAPIGETIYCISVCNIITKENPAITFNDVSAKWCNNLYLPYTAARGTVTVDSIGVVRCSDQKLFNCRSENCKCKRLKGLLRDIRALPSSKQDRHISNAIVKISDKAILDRVWLQFLTNVSIIGENNFTVLCYSPGFLYIYNCTNLTIEGIRWIGCGHDEVDEPIPKPVIQADYSAVKIQKNTFQYSMGQAIIFRYSHFIINQCNFVNSNYYTGHGAAVTVSNEDDYDKPHNAYDYVTQIISDCDFSFNEGVKSIVYLDDDIYVSIRCNNTTFYNNQGVVIYLSQNCSLNISGDILIKNNRAENGAGIYISDHSTVTFDENSNVTFINNSVDHSGSAIYMDSHSIVTFAQNSKVTFNDNKGISGTIYSEDNSNITFEPTSQVIFNSNSVTQYGAAIYSYDNSHVTFTGSSNVTFSNNTVSTNVRSKDMEFGGIIFSSTYSHALFDDNSTVVFSNNSANVGAAIFSFYKSNITFKSRSKVMFNNNVAQYCGTVTSALFSDIVFNDNTEVKFYYNSMLHRSTNNGESSAGAICTSQQSKVIFSGYSLVTFINNKADRGGAVVFSDSNITIKDYSIVTFNSNIAEYSNGGAFVCFNNSIVTIRGNSDITFNNNKASQSGGAIHTYSMCNITFKDNSTSSFINNTARGNGGAIISNQLSEITFDDNSTMMFDGNTADNGGAFYFTNSIIRFKGTSMISFYNNKAKQNGGVGYFSLNSDVLFSQFTNVTFSYNSALYGGAVLANDYCNVTVTGNSVLLFVNNEASQSGGAEYFSSHCNVIMEDDAMVTFENNKALQGGAVCFNNKTVFLSKGNTTAFFYNNLAIVGGGAATVLNNSTFILQDNVTINFSNNHAQYGATISLDGSGVMVDGSDRNYIKFTNNFARIVGNSIYQDVADLCNRSCLTDRVVGISTEFIATPPNELKFYDPAICIDNDNDTQCSNYYIQNIMLGSEIIIPACVLDHYNHSVESTQFLVQSEFNSSYVISGPEQILIGCNTFEGITITGNKIVSKSTNLSVGINLHVDHNADWKQISVTLIIELSKCHLGFWQSSESQKCECYNANDIVYCSGSSSVIKRGYWFGTITEKPTVTFCPINYCNFTCCKTSDGYYHLSPVRDDQCRSHRSGTACGSCKSGYTLSFDSTECVSVESCTAGQTILVTMLTVTYWIVMVIIVFAIMHYRVEVGYLYCITYYYSIVDIILSQNLQATKGLYLTVSIISSFSKITPQFLGELCLTTGMSGIDQQFIHYIHPSAIIVLLVVISLLARCSVRISTFISRAIIRVICVLLFLSYTSIASTSLLLMRSLLFHKINKVYTYLSPDIEYFHGRHLGYAIVALVCIVTIVFGLPFLLTIEPFINHKINFTRIKPLLDQFQGCYKDKWRCFAAYYMIGRLVIIAIIIFDFSNDFISSYAIIIVCGIADFLHGIAKPYNKEILNKFDSAILHLIIFIAVLPLIDDFDSPVVIAIAFVLVILPLLIFITLTLFLYKDNLKKIFVYFTFKKESHNNNVVNNDEIPMKNFDLIIDDSMRKNATICAM